MQDTDTSSRDGQSVVAESAVEIGRDIRTSLNAIIGFTEVIMEERFGPIGSERRKSYLRDIHTSGLYAMALLDDLLDPSRARSNRSNRNPAAIESGESDPSARAAVEAGERDDLESAYRHREGEIIDSVGATLDRMIERADHTSNELDILLRRLAETAGAHRPAA